MVRLARQHFKEDHQQSFVDTPFRGYEKAYYRNNQIGFCGIDEAGLKDFDYALLAGEYPNNSWADNDKTYVIKGIIIRILMKKGSKA